MNILDFEAQVLSIEEKIKELRNASAIGDVNVANEISKMQTKVDKILQQIYQKLTPWQTVQVARHPDRPKFLDYLKNAFSNFVELSGDRLFADDYAIIGGFAQIDDIKCVVIGQEKGSDTESRLKHNFGMPKPEGYRKVYRLLELADKFSLPIISFIDTSGAFPGVESEERGQAEAIAKCMEKSFQINVPYVSVVIGEGGSGGAVAMATSDYILMLEYSIYSVISPEGCSSILWRDEKKSDIAADSQKLTASDLLALKIIDEIVIEPIGGAHRNKEQTIANVKLALCNYLKDLRNMHSEDRKQYRRAKFKSIGDQFLIL
ncbi:MAG: acetyl-CoA carboxylase carboxyltransferase subunit alpha [Holosporales bacterium]|nr:acetyl-CoA carboxylase carboxyltransferase subunit alpha [Holosporales bacterium]